MIKTRTIKVKSIETIIMQKKNTVNDNDKNRNNNSSHENNHNSNDNMRIKIDDGIKI